MHPVTDRSDAARPRPSSAPSAGRTRLAALVLAVAASACWPLTDVEDSQESLMADGGDVVFLTQSEPVAVTMDALFVGRVVLDASGCLRSEEPANLTMIWPHGFELARAGGVLAVVDAEGELVGRIGESFSLGGGVVSTLPSAAPLDAATRARAETACPGSYWFVGEVYEG